MELLSSFPLLLVDDELHDDTAAGRATRALVEQLGNDGTLVITASELGDAEEIIASNATLSGLMIGWDTHQANGGPGAASDADQRATRTERLIGGLRSDHPTMPIFLLADRSLSEDMPTELLEQVNGYLWKLEDTPAFVANRVEEARREYLEPLLPPFFGALARFTKEARYSWHTPGHSGGTAFLKTPVGSAFHQFFGENTLRSDLSVSVAELGSLMEHTGPVGEAEALAAEIFGADRTLFVTNGTSTANKIVFHACVRQGDVVLVDRNCHKSIMHAIVMTGAIPVYLHPVRNSYGIIGPIPPLELAQQTIAARLAEHPLIDEAQTSARLAVVTNCTYDGLCYDATAVLGSLAGQSERVLFDEAWFAYAHFHPLYAGRHAMGIEPQAGQPPTFATQSTHKLLTAFSQASMVHLRDPDHVISKTALEEAFMMHTSTSPQYGIIASLDVAAKTMQGTQGTSLIDDSIAEALAFRQALTATPAAANSWAFRVWQAPGAVDGSAQEQRDPQRWLLRDGEAWHGYEDIGSGHVMLDPLKVTILTPGIAPDGTLETHGIPAALVSRFLDERGIVVEKTGTYSILVLFSLGVTHGKAGTLLAELGEFKHLYDSGASLEQAMPRLVAEHPTRYANLTLADLARDYQAALLACDMTQLSEAMYAELPQPVLTPSAAYAHIVSDDFELVAAGELAGRVSTAMVVPYPPGIPVIMPGERFPAAGGALLRYLAASQSLDRSFPAFETEIHGVQVHEDGTYMVACLPPEGDNPMIAAYIAIGVVLVALFIASLSIRILKQYERAVLFELGKVKGEARGPGLIVFIPLIDRIHRVSLRIITMPIQSQGIITKDNVSIDVSAVAYYRVCDAIRSVVAIENVAEAINQIAQTTLRAVVGRHTLDQTLSETDSINENIKEILDVQTEEWGIQVTLVELKDIQLPDTMKRAMARQAEAEREKRAKIIAAEGEALAAGELARASDVMMAHPLALQLRNLQTLVEIAVDKNSTVVFPAPLMSTIGELGTFLRHESEAVAGMPAPAVSVNGDG